MDYLDPPDPKIWQIRQAWVEQQDEEAMGAAGSFFLSEQACALTAEVQACFCAGAWIAVIILTLAVIDAQLREIEFPDHEGTTYTLLNNLSDNTDLHWLRKRRNQLVHINPDKPAITVDDLWSPNQVAEYEKDAKKAVRLMFEILYLTPGT